METRVDGFRFLLIVDHLLNEPSAAVCVRLLMRLQRFTLLLEVIHISKDADFVRFVPQKVTEEHQWSKPRPVGS